MDNRADVTHDPVVATTLFNGDLSSLHELCLQGIRSELPWRNMVNLTSFTLAYKSWGDSSLRHLLDFFESAPRLRNIQLHLETQTFGAQSGRLVSLVCLKRMDILGGHSPSLLLDHLLIPVGAKLATKVEFGHSYLPKSLDELGRLPGFTLHIHVAGFYPSLRLNGRNTDLSIIPATPKAPATCRALESISRFDPSKVERLRIAGGDLMIRDGSAVYAALIPMKHLRTLTISRCKNLHRFMQFLDGSPMCPKLEELVIDPRVDGERFDIQRVIRMADYRARRGTKLKSVRIVSRDKFVKACALKLKDHVLHVECGPRVALASDGIDNGDEED